MQRRREAERAEEIERRRRAFTSSVSRLRLSSRSAAVRFTSPRTKSVSPATGCLRETPATGDRARREEEKRRGRLEVVELRAGVAPSPEEPAAQDKHKHSIQRLALLPILLSPNRNTL